MQDQDAIDSNKAVHDEMEREEKLAEELKKKEEDGEDEHPPTPDREETDNEGESSAQRISKA